MNTISPDNHIVLIVDDSPDTLGMLNEALESTGMTTLVALEGKQALTIAQKLTPDVILLDAIMPGMDGFETCEKLKANPDLKNIPVIFMTGLSDTDSIVKGFAAGGVDYLTKPINPKELVARINAHLINARTALSAQQALDSAGQTILAVNNYGVKQWATPAASKLLEELTINSPTNTLEDQLKHWLANHPTEDNKMPFCAAGQHYTAIYFGLSDQGEHLIRLNNDTAIDEASVLKEQFGITKRESDVFLWLAKGKTNREIAQIIDISPRTVNKHLEQLFKKLAVDNRTTAAAMAIQCLQKKRG
ncbi:response regulator [Saccharophagus degradans]|uniref:Response regulator n=1 Tax=Saccharophagus degradans TaxID=86304 RepID=A0AAW7X2C2_9GAMM|nr:response regulator transcription factor [Saccharophagus degradans]MBU2985148.1 response regulator [Saccharophagus degradans]MDO6421649.1 response regulator [Saccharophagus degradans]MDO6608611.1 response regulator [Saccharophagus degradans]